MTQTSALLNPAATSPETSIVVAAATKQNSAPTAESGISPAQKEARDTDFAALVDQISGTNTASEHLLQYKAVNSQQSAAATLLSDGAENILFFLQHGAETIDANGQATDVDALLASLDPQAQGQLSPEVLATLLNSIESGSITKNTIQTTNAQSQDNGENDILSLLTFIVDQSENRQTDGKSRLENLRAYLNSTDSTDVILSNLTPEERTDLQGLIDRYQSGYANSNTEEDRELIEALYAQFVTLTQTPVQRTGDISGSGAKQNKTETTLISTAASTQNSSGQQTAATALAPALSAEEQTTANASSSTLSESATEGDREQIPPNTFKDALERNSKPQTPAANLRNNNAPINTPDAQAKITAQDTQTQISTNGAVLAIDGTIAQSTPLQSSITQNITQSQSAAHAHPATQQLSATIQKAVKAGDDTKIKLTLNPAELGRVEVKISIDQDNISKIVLTAEKPETFMMLRRDADVLERALVESGLDAKSDLSFEMAKDGREFDNSHSQNDNHRDNHSSGANGDAEEVIETKMNWITDPNTGLMHYNIVV